MNNISNLSEGALVSLLIVESIRHEEIAKRINEACELINGSPLRTEEQARDLKLVAESSTKSADEIKEKIKSLGAEELYNSAKENETIRLYLMSVYESELA